MTSSSGAYAKQSLGYPHNLDFLLENIAFPSDARNNYLQEKPRLLYKEIEPYSSQLQKLILLNVCAAPGCAYKWCAPVIIFYVCGEAVRGQGKRICVCVSFWSCDVPASVWCWRCWQELEIPPALTLDRGASCCWVSCFVQRQSLSPPTPL